jgi:clusterin-associated protein 1
MTKYVENLEKDQKSLEEKIKSRSRQLEQAEKRFKGMTAVKPAF